jgi:hydroxypyruvate reductase
MTDEHSPHAVARACIEAGIDAAHPRRVAAEKVAVDGSTLSVCGEAYDLDAYDEILVLGGGNGAGTLAAALENTLGDAIADGLVVTDAVVETDAVTVAEGDHPLPTERNEAATTDLLARASDATAETLVLAPVTGGGSALLCAPKTTASVPDLQAVTDGLLSAGADIHDVNVVRRALSRVKGGGLAAAAAPATVVGLIVSDVHGDDPAVVASGPTVPTVDSPDEARAVLDRYGVDVPEGVAAVLDAAGEPEDEDRGGSVDNYVLASSATALDAAGEHAAAAGYDPLVLSTRMRGEAREIAKAHVAIAEECLASGQPTEPPVAVLSGGETTVTVTGDGEGGPNLEFCLSAALELSDEGITVGAVDTDGIDGATDAAGAVVDASTFPGDDREDLLASLADNDAYPPLAGANALIATGETGTNVNDLRVILVSDPSG